MASPVLINPKGGLFVTVHSGWAKLMRGSMSAFDGRKEDYPDRGFPYLLMEPNAGHDLASIVPCGYDDHTVWIRGPEESPELPHAMISQGRADYSRVVRVLPQLVAVAPLQALQAWPCPGAPASDLTVPPHADTWLRASSIYDGFTKPKGGVTAAIERYLSAV